MHNTGTRKFLLALGMVLLHTAFGLFVIMSSIWLCLALWFQQPFGGLVTRLLIGIWIAFALSILGLYITQYVLNRQTDVLIYVLFFLVGLFWYFGLQARQDREWNPEVAQTIL